VRVFFTATPFAKVGADAAKEIRLNAATHDRHKVLGRAPAEPPRTPDAVKRMEAGADFDEQQYVADLMNLVSQELGKRKP
jgi:hypothetical protein